MSTPIEGSQSKALRGLGTVNGMAILALPSMTAPTVAAGLIGGFGVAQKTGVRPLGGVVLTAAGSAAATTWLKRDGAATMGVLATVYVGGFVGSHVLAKKIGAWPAVLSLSAASAAAAYALSDRKAR